MIEGAVKSDLEAPAWETAQDALATDVACLTGEGECPGEKRGMKLVEVTDADVATARDILLSSFFLIGLNALEVTGHNVGTTQWAKPQVLKSHSTNRST